MLQYNLQQQQEQEHPMNPSNGCTSTTSTGDSRYNTTLQSDNNNESDDVLFKPVQVAQEPMLRKRNLRTKVMYICILLITIVFIYISSPSSSSSSSTPTTTLTSTKSSNFVQIVLLHHEPSIRIFRSIIEMLLVLLCTSLSILYYVQYIPVSIIQSLLFTSIYATNDDDDDDDDNDDHDENNQNNNNNNRYHDNHLFDDPLSEDIVMQDERVLVANNQQLSTSHVTKQPDSSQIILLQQQQQQQTQRQRQQLQEISYDIMNIVCDTFMYTLITFILYIISALHATTYDNSNSSTGMTLFTNTNIIAKIAAPTFPLLLVVYILIRLIQYRSQFHEFYTIVSYTIYAPFYNVTFRDGMIGDILTSMVRPMQDIAFTICYILFGLRSYYWQSEDTFTTNDVYDDVAWTNNNTSIGESFVNVADATVPAMERNWIVHTAILPACMISPLWWRFLQTIRQSYDTECRWPYLGNALKYFIAAQVAMVGVYHPDMRHHPVWIMSFVIATLYQIYWDVFMDWGLLVSKSQSQWKWELRSQRLYPYKSLYWILFVVNTLLRFCWTLNFIPFHYLSSKTGVLINNFSNEAWANILVPVIACAEIIRRTLWGLIRVEWETIKVQNETSGYEPDEKLHDKIHEPDVEMIPMKVEYDNTVSSYKYSTLTKLFTSDMSSKNKMNIFGELCMYTTTFALLGIIIAAHRGTL